MASLNSSGRLVELATAAAEFEALVGARNFFDKGPFQTWAELLRLGEPGGQALILPDSHNVSDDLILDLDDADLDAQSIRAILALGNLTVGGAIANLDAEDGPLLLVGGDLRARDVIKRGAAIVVLGDLSVSGTLFCDYSAAPLMTGGGVSSALIVLNDFELMAGGTVSGQLISSETSAFREVLRADVFADPDDPSDEWPDGALVADRILAGAALLKG
jgi:hypothetical protein